MCCNVMILWGEEGEQPVTGPGPWLYKHQEHFENLPRSLDFCLMLFWGGSGMAYLAWDFSWPQVTPFIVLNRNSGVGSPLLHLGRFQGCY